MPIEQFLARLDKVRQIAPDRWIAACPAHEDKRPSLSIRLADDRILIHDFVGCYPADVCDAMGIRLADLMPDDPSYINRREEDDHKVALGELFDLIAHEVQVASIIAAQAVERRQVRESDWERLAQCSRTLGEIKARLRPRSRRRTKR